MTNADNSLETDLSKLGHDIGTKLQWIGSTGQEQQLGEVYADKHNRLWRKDGNTLTMIADFSGSLGPSDER